MNNDEDEFAQFQNNFQPIDVDEFAEFQNENFLSKMAQNVRKNSPYEKYKKQFEEMEKNPNVNEEYNSPKSLDTMRALGFAVEPQAALGIGAAENLGNLGISAYNAPESIANFFGTHLYNKAPHINLGGIYSNPLSKASHFSGGFIGPGAAAKPLAALNKATSFSSKSSPILAGLANFGLNTGKSALAGYTFGENEEGNRGLGTAIGAIAPAAIESGIGIKNAIGKIPEIKAGMKPVKELVEDVFSGLRKRKAVSSYFYNKVEDAATKHKATVFLDQSAPIHRLEENLPDKYLESLNTWQETFRADKGYNFTASHKLEKDLKKYVRNLQPENKLTTPEKNTKRAANKLIDQIKKGMREGLRKKGLTNEIKDLDFANKYYEQNVTPYYRSKAVRDWENKSVDLTADTFAKRFGNSETYKEHFTQYHPEFAMKDTLKSFAPDVSRMLLGPALGYYAYKGLNK
jgi:hypothetical protein